MYWVRCVSEGLMIDRSAEHLLSEIIRSREIDSVRRAAEIEERLREISWNLSSSTLSSRTSSTGWVLANERGTNQQDSIKWLHSSNISLSPPPPLPRTTDINEDATIEAPDPSKKVCSVSSDSDTLISPKPLVVSSIASTTTQSLYFAAPTSIRSARNHQQQQVNLQVA